MGRLNIDEHGWIWGIGRGSICHGRHTSLRADFRRRLDLRACFESARDQVQLRARMAMAAYGRELSRLVDELNRSTPQRERRKCVDRSIAGACRPARRSDVILVAGSGIALRVRGPFASPAGKPLSSEELRSLLLPLFTARQAEDGDQQVAGFLFCARLRSGDSGPTSTISAERLAASIRFAACANSLARVAAPAAGPGPISRTAARSSTAHRPYRLRQDLDPGCASRPDQRPPPRSHHHHRGPRRVSACATAARS